MASGIATKVAGSLWNGSLSPVGERTGGYYEETKNIFPFIRMCPAFGRMWGKGADNTRSTKHGKGNKGSGTFG